MTLNIFSQLYNPSNLIGLSETFWLLDVRKLTAVTQDGVYAISVDLSGNKIATH